MDPNRFQRAADKLIAFHKQAQERNEWTFFVDEMYARECVYTCEYAGTMVVRADGIDDIKATHYGRDMRKGWEGWTFPYIEVFVGSAGRVVTHWMNRGPGTRPDGSWFETPGVSFITFGLGPMLVTSDMTSCSRIGSIGGFVTCANSCLKYLNRSCGRSDSTASGVSVPIDPSGSSPCLAIGARKNFRSSSV